MPLLSRRMFRKTWEWLIKQSFCLLWSVKRWYVVCIRIGIIYYFCYLIFRWKRLAQEMVLFVDWSHLYYSRDHPAIIIIPPNEIEIHPYSTDILYYTAGFILQRLSVAKTEKGSFRYWFTTFAESNTMLLEDTIDEGPPTSIIEHC